jgi:hypothetical protein
VVDFRNDVVDLERQLIGRLRHPTVFTAVVGSLANLSTKALVHDWF